MTDLCWEKGGYWGGVGGGTASREEFWLFECAHVNQRGSLEVANYKIDNTAGARVMNKLFLSWEVSNFININVGA